MANSDSAAQNVRFNLDAQQLEFALGLDWIAVPASGATPAGADTQIQFNDSGDFGASSDLAWDGSELIVGPIAGITPVSTVLAGEIQLLNSGTSPTAYIDLQSGTGGYIHITDNGNVGPDDSAVLQAHSITRGFLPPVMTNTQRDAITAPAEGLTIYSTSDHALEFWNGSVWKVVATV